MVSGLGVTRIIWRASAGAVFFLMFLLSQPPQALAQQEFWSDYYVPNAGCVFRDLRWLCQGSPPQEPPKYTALAISNSTMAIGTSWGYDNRQAAEQRALAECRKTAKDCEVAIWAYDRCIALATAPDGSWGVDSDMYVDFAQAKALRQCNSVAKNCVIKAHPCARD